MGKYDKQQARSVLAIYPNARGYGYAVMDNALSVVEANIITIRPICNNRCVNAISKLLDYFDPVVVILEDYEHPSTRKAGRIKKLIDSIRDLAIEKKIAVKGLTRADIRFTFSNFNAHSKYEISKVITENIPVLKDKFMGKRKPYESEKYTTGIFDAVSLGVTYYHKES